MRNMYIKIRDKSAILYRILTFFYHVFVLIYFRGENTQSSNVEDIGETKNPEEISLDLEDDDSSSEDEDANEG